jgi:hypothetical protein
MFSLILFGIVGCLSLGCDGLESFPGTESLEQATRPAKRALDLDQLLKELRSTSEKVRAAAAKKLKEIQTENLNLSTQAGLKVLRAAAQPIPFAKPDPAEVSADLIDLLVGHPRPEYVPYVVQLYDRFSEGGRAGALLLVTQIESRDAAEAYMKIFRTHAKAGKIVSPATEPLRSKPRHPDVFFPELLTYATDPKLSFDIYQLCLDYCEAELLKPETLAPFTDQALESYRIQSRELFPLQKAEGVSWMWEEQYLGPRSEAAVLLDLFGYFRQDKVLEELERALRYRDPKLKYFAISSLLRLGKEVNAKPIEGAAAYAEVRNYLFDRLQKIGKEDLFPKKYRTQEAFAEANMVDWLAHPAELGRVPDEIELMKAYSMDLGGQEGVCDYYVFRFRMLPPHEAAKEGWLAGVAGPFRQKDEPTTNALGHTFSAFEKWESRSPEDHLKRIRELIEEQMKKQAKEGEPEK